MRILFHVNTLCYRGTTVSTTEYARYNKLILNNESIICYNSSLPGTQKSVFDTLEKEFKVVSHDGNNIDTVISKEKIDLAYFQRAGKREFLPTNCQTAVHSVFQFYQPHGNRYAYISKWLADLMNRKFDGQLPAVPYIVTMPEPTEDFRKKIGISQNKIVIGRHGGKDTFDLKFVKRMIPKFLEKHNNYVFLFLGTDKWIDHSNVIFLAENNDLQYKSNFIHACDSMLHARSNGESFGLAIAEFLYHDKPVISWTGGEDQNHVSMLTGYNTLYTTDFELVNILENIKDIKHDWKAIVSEFSPSNIMKTFKNVFIDK